MDTERSKAQLRRNLVQLHAFEALLFPSWDKQPSWETWADSCHTLADLATELRTVASNLSIEYEQSLEEQAANATP
jgi:hypothetical protein